MNRKNGAAAVLFVLLCGTLPVSAGASFGPEAWHEYRLNDENNPVYENEGESPLETGIFRTGDEVRSTPVVVGDRLYAGNHNTGEMYAFDIRTKEEIWRAKAPNWVHSEMIYNEGTLYVGFGNRFFENGVRGTGDSGVMAVDAATGEEVWTAETGGEVMPTPVYHEGSVYAATGDRHLYKLNGDTGDVEERINLGHIASMSSPNEYEGRIYVGGGAPRPYTFSAVDLETGNVDWQTEMPDAFAGLDDVPPAISEDIVVTTALEGPSSFSLKDVYDRFGVWKAYEELGRSVIGKGTTYPEHVLYAMDSESGDVLWQESLGFGEMVKNNKSGAPMIYDGNIYVGSPITKTFYSYDLKTGERQFEFRNTVMKAPPVAHEDVVYFTNAEGFVHALDAESGEEVGRKELGGTLAPSGPIIMNDTLIAGSQDSNVYAMPLGEIQNADDEFTPVAYEKSAYAEFVIVVYIIPLIVLLAVGAGIILFVRRNRRKKSGAF